jgi:predicted AAA+ superfamily ATPase
MIKRIFWENSLKKLANEWRLIAFLGPRQVGKSTYIKEKGVYYSFDDPVFRREVSVDPVYWLKREFKKSEKLILDEATRLPELFEAMKIVADENPSIKGRICFSSSSNYLTIKMIRESLAGRVIIYHASGLLFSEISGCAKPAFFNWLAGESIGEMFIDRNRIIDTALNNSLFPEPYTRNDTIFAGEWLKQYIGTYVMQDIIEGYPRSDLSKWQSFIAVLFSYPASTISLNKISKDIGIHRSTCEEYVNMAKTAFLCRKLPIYSKSPLKRLTKAPKYIMVDSALCQALNLNLQIGNIFENLIISQIIFYLEANLINFNAYHWQTQDNAEVDLILEGDFGLIPIEIKHANEITHNMLSGIKSFLSAHPNVKKACVLYNGSKSFTIDNISILPVQTLYLE